MSTEHERAPEAPTDPVELVAYAKQQLRGAVLMSSRDERDRRAARSAVLLARDALARLGDAVDVLSEERDTAVDLARQALSNITASGGAATRAAADRINAGVSRRRAWRSQGL